MRALIAVAALGAFALSCSADPLPPPRAPAAAGPANAFPAFATGAAPELFPRFAVAPLDSPLTVTDDFGERRTTHFHAALDFSTQHVVGKPVYAPAAGYIERMHPSGGGYGRMLSLRTDDGRTVLFGHLDAYDGAAAAWLDSLQNATHQYEQDVTPEPGRFRVAAGERVAWSGQSGAGPAHLHVEVRKADMAYNPLRAGLPMTDTRAPVIRRIAIEPVGDGSWVEGRATAFVWPAGGGDTVRATGRVRVSVEAEDGFDAARGHMACYAVGVEFGASRIECRMDSVSWGTDMPDVNQVFAGDFVRLWATAFRPRVIHVSGSGGWLEVPPGAPPRPLRVTARDASGHEAVRVLWLGPGGAPDTSGAGLVAAVRGRRAARGTRVARAGAFQLALEPAGPGRDAVPALRITATGVPLQSRGVTIELAPLAPAAPAPRAGAGFAALVPVTRASQHAEVVVRGRAEGRAWEYERALWIVPGSQAGPGPVEAAGWRVESGAWYEPGALTIATAPSRPRGGLVAAGDALTLGPLAPLRTAWTIVAPLPAGRETRRMGLYRDGSTSLSWIAATLDPAARTLRAEVRTLGRFVVLEDVVAPRIALRRAPRAGRAGAGYSRWALEARLGEFGSGIEPASTHFVVDGVAVPSEWEVEASTLRWRPRTPPPAGAHAYQVVATDRAGNVARAQGRFVIR